MGTQVAEGGWHVLTFENSSHFDVTAYAPYARVASAPDRYLDLELLTGHPWGEFSYLQPHLRFVGGDDSPWPAVIVVTCDTGELSHIPGLSNQAWLRYGEGNDSPDVMYDPMRRTALALLSPDLLAVDGCNLGDDWKLENQWLLRYRLAQILTLLASVTGDGTSIIQSLPRSLGSGIAEVLSGSIENCFIAGLYGSDLMATKRCSLQGTISGVSRLVNGIMWGLLIQLDYYSRVLDIGPGSVYHIWTQKRMSSEDNFLRATTFPKRGGATFMFNGDLISVGAPGAVASFLSNFNAGAMRQTSLFNWSVINNIKSMVAIDHYFLGYYLRNHVLITGGERILHLIKTAFHEQIENWSPYESDLSTRLPLGDTYSSCEV